ncbi:UNVERIFIED_CONTAM: Long chain acyl-CoA synthetase 4, partial [Sesamum indicum]
DRTPAFGGVRGEVFRTSLEMEEKRFIVEVEPSKPAQEGKPSIGAVYRSIFAKDGFPPPIPGLDSCWDIFRLSVEKYPENRMLGRREMVNGKDVKLLVEDIVELQPSVFCAVPRVLDRIYSGLQQKISSGGLIKQTAFNFSYSLKLRNMRNGFKQSVASPICDKLVFNLVKQGLGGNVRLILSGAAPLASHVEEYLRVVTCSYVLQGYGLTETCAGTFVSIPDEMNMLGTVGPPLPNVDVCLESVPEMGYDALSRTPRGEVCVRGDTLFSGYYKREDLTKEVLIDGWFHTGDIGEWQPNGSLKIIDRKKNIFKLSQGEYVAVENLENIYSLAPDIESIWVYGNSFESFLVAIINPNKQAVEQWAEQNGIFGNFNGLCENTQVKNYFLGELTRIAKEKKLKGFEFIKAIHLDPVPFDMERDLITPTYKKKRPQLLKYYQDMIDSMYKNAK